MTVMIFFHWQLELPKYEISADWFAWCCFLLSYWINCSSAFQLPPAMIRNFFQPLWFVGLCCNTLSLKSKNLDNCGLFISPSIPYNYWDREREPKENKKRWVAPQLLEEFILWFPYNPPIGHKSHGWSSSWIFHNKNYTKFGVLPHPIFIRNVDFPIANRWGKNPPLVFLGRCTPRISTWLIKRVAAASHTERFAATSVVFFATTESVFSLNWSFWRETCGKWMYLQNQYDVWSDLNPWHHLVHLECYSQAFFGWDCGCISTDLNPSTETIWYLCNCPLMI